MSSGLPEVSDEELDRVPLALELTGLPYVLVRLSQNPANPERVRLTVHGGGPGVSHDGHVRHLLQLALGDTPAPVTEPAPQATLSPAVDEPGESAVDNTPSPDCEQGKHPACTGQAWDHKADELTACSCTCHA